MTPAVMFIIFANVAMYLLAAPGTPLYIELALFPAGIVQRPWSPISYMFLHANFSHILFNMLSLYFFGPALEMRLGTRHFVQLYFIAGLMGALCSYITPGSRYSLIVGASGATFGVTLGFAWFWPRQLIYLWGVLGIEARWMVVAMTVISVMSARTNDGIAHFAHLGGYLGAWLYLLWMRHTSPAAQWQRKVSPPRPKITFAADLERYKKIDPAIMHPVNREEYQRVMNKVTSSGLGGLNAEEREFLERFAPKA